MHDVAPELLELIQKDFEENYSKSELIASLYQKVRNGTATYLEVNDYAIEVGEILANAYQRNLSSSVLPDGHMYYNIANRILTPTLTNNYNLIREVTSDVQTSLNKKTGIGIKALVPKLNEDRIKGLIEKIVGTENFDDVKWVLDEPVKNFSQSIVDDSIKDNAEFQYEAGMQPQIVRRLAGGCCDWCKEVAGIYIYPKVPRDVYRRHQRCRCTVEYDPGTGKRQNVHTKKWRTQEEYDKIEIRKRVGLENESNSKKINYRKHVGENNLSYAESRALVNYVSSDSYTINYKLRSGDELTNAEKQFCIDLDNALKKMPKYKGNLSRSLYFYSDEDIDSFVKKFTEDEIISFNEYISTTKGNKLYNPDGQVHLYIQDSQNGCDLRSFNSNELEVLYERDSKFIVISKMQKDNIWYILLQEA